MVYLNTMKVFSGLIIFGKRQLSYTLRIKNFIDQNLDYIEMELIIVFLIDL